jgi:hypothetical protein
LGATAAAVIDDEPQGDEKDHQLSEQGQGHRTGSFRKAKESAARDVRRDWSSALIRRTLLPTQLPMKTRHGIG